MVAAASLPVALPSSGRAAPPTGARCGPSSPPTSPTSPAGPGVRAIDWCNAEVGVWGGALAAGRAEVHLDDPEGRGHDTTTTTLRSIDYADVDGDGRPEALLVLERASWVGDRPEAMVGSDLAVFTVRGGRPTLVASLPIGTPVLDLTIRRGTIAMVSGPDRARQRWRWDRRTRTLVAARR